MSAGRDDRYPPTAGLANRQQQAGYTGTSSENDAMSVESDSSQLFIVRVWNTSKGGTGTWHGRVQHVLRGESHSFAGWSQLMNCFEAMLRSAESTAGDGSETPE